jgi:tRNA threonylcarbamoyladenosine biosynthesis protein TsaB
MANAVLNKAGKYLSGPGTLLCPMIDARRMEVYTAVYNMQMQEVKNATALILEERSYGELLDQHRIVFSGNGSIKWKKLCSHNNAFFADEVVCTAADMANLSYQYYRQKNFSLPSTAEPFYLKDFYTVTPR